MKRITAYITSATVVLLLPTIVFAQQFGADGAGGLGEKINSGVGFINGVLVPFLLTLAMLYFIFGVFQYFIQGGSDEEKREAGKQAIFWAIISMVAIVSFWGIVSLFTGAVGLDEDNLEINVINPVATPQTE